MPVPATDPRFPDIPLQQAIAARLEGPTPSLLSLVERLAVAAQHDVTVLLTGETGTGKTWLARLIHDFSRRRAEPFLVVPCGSLAPSLIEAELFGHVRGAFTGAERTRVGKFAAAGQGTLLLDEIDTLGLEQQAKLLRVLESGEFEPVGSDDTQRRTCRVIATSNVDLEGLMDQRKFRQDLYYRLQVLVFHIPPLRARPQDIVPLVRAAVARFSATHGKELAEISPPVWDVLQGHDWPGNLRELENAIQQAVLLSEGPVLSLRDLPAVLQEQAMARQLGAWTELAKEAKSHAARERRLIERALVKHYYCRTRAARELGISRVTLYCKMRKHDIPFSRTHRLN